MQMGTPKLSGEMSWLYLLFLLCTSQYVGAEDLDVNVVISDANAAVNQQQIQSALPSDMNQVQTYSETINSAQAACPPGYYCIGDVAPFIPCPPGTYQPLYTANHLSQCLLCPAGQYCPQASAMPTPCPGGSYRSTPNATKPSDCATCPVGSYCPSNSTNFTQCPMGTYNSLTAQDSFFACVACPQGQYCPLGASTPTQCASGTYRGRTNGTQQGDCTTCPSGNYCPQGSVTPTNCSAGTYNNLTSQGSLFSCIACPSGQYCPLGASLPTPCAAGTYRIGTNGTQQANCTICPSGNYCPLAAVNPTNCSAGTYNPATGSSTFFSCLACPSGQYCPLAASNPTPCSAGTYRGGTNGTQQGNCTTCPSGNYCPPGSVTPTNCSAGTYNSLSNQSSSASCLLCQPGTYCAVASINPQSCAANTFSLVNAPTCSVCPAYSTSPIKSPNCTCDAGHTQTVVTTGGIPGAVSYTVVGVSSYAGLPGNPDTGAPYMTFLTINGYTNISVVKGQVLTLTLSPFEGMQSDLKLYYNVPYTQLDGNSQSAFVLNPADASYRIVTFANYFLNHQSNQNIAPYQFTSGVTGSGTGTLVFDTTNAAAGVYYLASNGVSFTDFGYYVLTIQVQAPSQVSITFPSFYNYFTAMATYGDILTVLKPVGQPSFSIYCDPNSDTVGNQEFLVYQGASSYTWDTSTLPTDVQCYWTNAFHNVFNYIIFRPRLPAVGSGSVSVLTCPNCSAGYRSSPGDVACSECGQGYYSAAVSETCTICPVGTKCNSTTTPEPIPCGLGAYQPSTGATFCIQCPLGAYCGSKTTANPVNCSAGTYAPAMGASACTACALGKYSLSVGSSLDCPACAANSYCASPTSIAVCPLNTQSPAGSASLLKCICMPGYQCTYTKRISLVITLTNVSQSAFQNNVNNVRTNLIKAIAKAANVSEAQVNVTSFSPHVPSGGRRLLTTGHSTHMGLHRHTMHHSGRMVVSKGVQMLTPASTQNKRQAASKNALMLDVFSEVHGAKRITNLNHHLAAHSVPLHTWREISQGKK